MILDKKIPVSYIFRKVRLELFFVIAVGLIFNFLTHIFSGFIPEMPLSVPAFLGTAISILLSFKMSQSYERWWEARKVWGSIVNDSRSLVLQLQAFINGGNDEVIKQMAYRQIAWCYALGQSLRGADPIANLEPYLTRTDLELVSKHSNKHLALLQLNNSELKTLRQNNKLELLGHIQIDNTLVRLCDAMGKAERINSTVFPVTYRMFLHFAIYLFVIVLSISLKEVDAVFEIPLLVLISAVFFLLEKTAYHLQDPFRNRPSDTAVTAIARTIEINIKHLLNEKEIPKPITSETFYIL